jgi:serine/threonine-protein kinase RsbW
MEDTSREFARDDLKVLVEVTLPGHATAISPVVDQIMKHVSQSCGALESDHDQIELALREALANAVRHGCKNDPSKNVHCTVGCDQVGDMIIVVRDGGEGFAPHEVPSPLVGENLFSHHGRGIFLINQLMDEVRFDKGGTEIRMVKRVRPGSRPDSTPIDE